MGFNPPDQDALEQARDAAQGESISPQQLCDPSLTIWTAAHNDFWANNGHTPQDDTFFPGFEAGWHAAIEKLVNGEELPGDLEGWAREMGSPHWEYEHGFRQGAEAARAAGHWDEEHHQEEHHEEEHHEEEHHEEE